LKRKNKKMIIPLRNLYMSRDIGIGTFLGVTGLHKMQLKQKFKD
jgi:hypothetical protein